MPVGPSPPRPAPFLPPPPPLKKKYQKLIDLSDILKTDLVDFMLLQIIFLNC